MVIWITGKGQSGKTTTAEKLASVINRAVVLDAHYFRRYFGGDFTDAGRRENVLRLARVAAILELQEFVPIVCCVSPTKELRDEARKMFKQSTMIYVPGGVLWEGTTYEEPDRSEIKEIADNGK
jgi:adenylylsulfate kinase-like enzyme